MMQVIVSDQKLRNTDGMQIGKKAAVVNYGGTEMPAGGENLGVFDLLLQQLAEMSEEDANSLIQQFQQLQDEEEQEGTDLAMQMLAEMLGDNPGMESILQELTAQNPGLVQQLQELAQDGGTNQGAALQRWLDAADQAQTTQAKTTTNSSSTAAETAAEGSDRISVEVPGTSETQDSQDSASDLLNGQSQFNNSVMEAKKMLKAKGASSENTNYSMVDVEKLQHHADVARADVAAKTTNTSLPEPEAKDVIEQLSKNFHQNIADGKNEFIVKLKPEGLGEITVKLTEGADKISMSIMTSSTQVAKLLSGELGMLKENLKPYNVEVREVVSEAQNASDALGAGSNEQFNQAFAGQQQQFASQTPEYYYYNDGEYGAEPPFPDEMLQMAPNAGLDAYI